MKITGIHALNFLAAPRKLIKFNAPVVCIAGPNAVGKSSLIESIRFGLIGQMPRAIEKKGDFALLITEGATEGSVTITVDDAVLTRDVASGKIIAGQPLSEEAEDWLPTVLDAHRFARMEAKPQRDFMFRLLGIRFDWPSVKAELELKELREDVIEALSVQIRSGFAAAAEHANTRAKEARGAWKAITGTTYGSKIGEDWRAPGADKPEQEINTSAQAARVELCRNDLSDLQATLARRTTQREAFLAAEAQLKDAPTDKQIQAQLKKERAAVERLEAEIALLQAKVQTHGGITGPCPRCEGLITFDAGAFHIAEGAAPAGPGMAEDLQRLKTELSNLRANLKSLEAKATRLATLRETMPPTVTERDVTDAQDAVVAAQRVLQDAEGALRDANADAAQAAEGRRRTAEAALHHADVVAWVQAEELMKPDGVQSTLLQRGLDPFNKQLAALAREIGWAPPRLGPDFKVRTGDRLYQLHSESEQYRIDTVIAAAIAITSGLKLLLLDRFDVLDQGGRDQLLGWLGAAGKDVFDTVIAAGTLKNKPIVLTERFGVHVIWLAPEPTGDS